MSKESIFSLNCSRFKVDFFDVYDPQIFQKLRGLIVAEGDTVRLTEKGIDVSNKVMVEFV